MESAKDVGKNVEVNKHQKALNNLIKNDYEYFDEKTNSHLYDKDLRKLDINILQTLADKVPYYKKLEDKATPKKPLIKYYHNYGEPTVTKICCPNDCGIQLNGLNKDNEVASFTHEHCPKCGQAIDWSNDE